MTRHAEDDQRLQRLIKDNPGFPPEVIAHLYRLDAAINTAKSELSYIEWRRKQIEEQTAKELEKKYGQENV